MSRLLRLFAPNAVAPVSRLVRDTVPFVLGDGRRIDVLRVRDPRAKRLKLSVDERGARLTLPLRASLVSGERFLHEHRDWLGAQFASFAGERIEALVRGASPALPLRGAQVPLRWVDGRVHRAGLVSLVVLERLDEELERFVERERLFLLLLLVHGRLLGGHAARLVPDRRR